VFNLLTAPAPEALIRELARLVDFWTGPPDRPRPRMPEGLPFPIGELVSLNQERSAHPLDASDRLLRPDELVVEENGDLFFLDIHQMGRVICARFDPTRSEHSAVLVDTPPDQIIDSLQRFVVSWALQQLVFTSPKELHEVDLVPVCERFGHPLELLWRGDTWFGEPLSFHLCNEQVLSFNGFNGYHGLDDDFRASIKKFYPKMRPEYPE
jgi:hypothetical protein